MGEPPFQRESRCEPIRFPSDIIVDLCESQGLKPPRGSWAYVSSRVMSIDNDREPFIEVHNAFPIEALEGNVDRSRDVLSLIFLRREYLN